MIKFLIPFIFTVIAALNAYSQGDKGQNSNKIFNAQPIVHEKSINKELRKHFSSYEMYHIDSRAIKMWANQKSVNNTFTLQFGNKQSWNFSIQENDGGQYTQVFVEKDGELILQKRSMPSTLVVDVEGKNENQGVFTVNDGYLSAGFHVDGQQWYIEQLNKYHKSAKADQYILYKGGDEIRDVNHKCGVKDVDNKSKIQQGDYSKSTTNPPFSDLCMDMQIVGDFAFYVQNGGNTLNRLVAIFNLTHYLYTSNDIGLHLQLSTVIIFENGDPYDPPLDLGSLLTSFIDWKDNSPQHDNAQLLTGLDLSNSAITMAFIGTICENSSAAVSETPGQDIIVSGIMTHSFGHNLGAIHDSNGNVCLNSGFIMSPFFPNPSTLFSSCSKDYFQNFNTQAQMCSGCTERPCDVAIPLSVCNDSITGSTSFLNGLAGMTTSCGDFADGNAPGIWYTMIGDGDSINLSTCHDSTDFDTQIAVYSGECVNLVCIDGVNDDVSCNANGNQASIKFLSQVNITYYIFISGRTSQDTGQFVLQTNRGSMLVDLNGPLSSGSYKSAGTLTSTSIITSGSVSFQAEQEIILNPNFTVNHGALFEAVIQNCANALKSEQSTVLRE